MYLNAGWAIGLAVDAQVKSVFAGTAAFFHNVKVTAKTVSAAGVCAKEWRRGAVARARQGRSVDRYMVR